MGICVLELGGWKGGERERLDDGVWEALQRVVGLR